MQTVEFQHTIGNTVGIKTNGRPGTVTGNFIGKNNQKQVLVTYADANGAIHNEYLSEDEVE